MSVEEYVARIRGVREQLTGLLSEMERIVLAAAREGYLIEVGEQDAIELRLASASLALFWLEGVLTGKMPEKRARRGSWGKLKGEEAVGY